MQKKDEDDNVYNV